VKKKRLSKVQELIRNNSEIYLSKLVNSDQEVLVEGVSKKNEYELFGRTNTNKTVHFKAPKELIGKCVNLHISKANRNSLVGVL